MGVSKGPAKRGVFSAEMGGSRGGETLKRLLETERLCTTKSKLFSLVPAPPPNSVTSKPVGPWMLSDFRKTEMMNALTGLQKTLRNRKQFSGPQPLRVLPVLSPADVYAFVHEGHSLSPSSSSHACLLVLTSSYMSPPQKSLP